MDCELHRAVNVLSALPRSAHPGAKKTLAGICNAEDRDDARRAVVAITMGPGSKAPGIAMAFKLIDGAQARWRAVIAPHLVALVRNGATFKRGELVGATDRPADAT